MTSAATFSSDPNVQGFDAALFKQEMERVSSAFKGLINLEKKNIDNQTKEEKELEKRKQLLRDAEKRRTKEWEDREIKDYQEKIKKDEERKKREDKLDKLKDSPLSKLIPQNIKQLDKPEEKGEDKNVGLFSKIGDAIKFIPEQLKTLNKKNETGEQKNLGVEIMRVSFNPEGIKILRTLLDPIYKALDSVTGNMDKSLTAIIKKMEGMFGPKGNFGMLAGLLLGLLSDLFVSASKLKSAFVWFWELPGKFMALLRDEGLYKFADFKAWFELRWEKYVKDPFNRMVKALNLEEPSAKFIDRVNKINKTIIESLKLDDLGAWISLRFEAWIINPIKNGWNLLKNLGQASEGFFNSYIVKPFEQLWNALKFIGNSFSSVFSGVTDTFRSLYTSITSADGLIMRFGSSLAKAVEWIKPLFSWIGPLAKVLSIEVLAIIDGVIDGFKTMFKVWGDVDLSGFEKTTAVILSFITGLIDFVPQMGSLLSKLLSGLWSWVRGKGFNTENSLSNAVDKNINEKGGVGQVVGNAVIGATKATKDTGGWLNAVNPFHKASYKDAENYRNASQEQKDAMDKAAEATEKRKAEHAKMEADKKESLWLNPFSWGKKKEEGVSKSTLAPLTEAPPQVNYEPAPNAPAVNQSDKKIDIILKNQNDINSQMLKTFQDLSKNISKQQGSTTVINSSQPHSSGAQRQDTYTSSYDEIIALKTSYMQKSNDRQHFA